MAKAEDDMKTALKQLRQDVMTVRRVVTTITAYGAEREEYAEVYTNIRCHLSLSGTDTIGTDNLPSTQYTATVFYDAADAALQRGDVVTVVKNGVEYIGTIGDVAAYPSHMQAPMQLRKR